MSAAEGAPLAVGLIGAGPWAARVYGPQLATGPRTRLAGVWARRPEAARELASTHGVRAARSVDELLDWSEAVAIAVAPDAQPALAIQAAREGKAVLLEKPIADSAPAARRLADAIGEAGVGSLVALTWRFSSQVRAFLEQAKTADVVGGRAWFLSGALLAGPFAGSPWRQVRGALLDVGPHAIDLVDCALGRILQVTAHASPGGWVGLQLQHDSGAVSQVSLCERTLPGDRFRAGAEVFGPAGVVEVDLAAAVEPGTFATLFAEFADVARTAAVHECDVRRGLYLQEVIDRAESQLTP